MTIDPDVVAPAPAPAPRERAAPRSRPAGLVLVLAVALVFALAGAGYSFLEARQDNKVEAARRSVTAVAQAYAVNLTTYDHASLDRDFAKVLDNSTGAFKTQYTTASETLRELIAKFKAKATGKVLETAVASVDGGHAQVLLFVDQTVVNANTKDPRIDRSRMKMGLEKQGNRWLISSLDLI